MSKRDAQIGAFIERAGWHDATIAPLAGDASNRRYLRLNRETGTQHSVLMDAPADKGEDIRPFINIARWLSDAGFSAPEIYAHDVGAGLMLLEDLGDALFARVIPKQPELENSLYSCATDVLVAMHDTPPPVGLSAYDTPLMTDFAALAFDWYLGAARGSDDDAKHAFKAGMVEALNTYAPDQDVLIQRDYHSENLLWLPERDDVARVGLLDFQDAMLGHRAYDLVSLLQDARRDVAPATEIQMIDRYISTTDQEPDTFRAAYHVLGAQRNLRILGVFARLCLRDGKAHYVDLIPRVWNLLQRDLTHPALSDLREIVNTVLPEPKPALLQSLKDQCATIPSQ